VAFDIRNINIPVPPRVFPSTKSNKVCDTCNKEDVCRYKKGIQQALNDISKISERENVFIETKVCCKKWSGTVNLERNIRY